MRNLLLGLLFSFLFNQLGAQEESSTNRIFWSDWYTLEWDDFQGTPQSETGIAAESGFGLPYEYQTDGEGSITITINVCFLKDESWSIASLQNKVLLTHEQLHFDIAELHRRMIVKELLELNLTKSNFKVEIEKTIKKYWLLKYRALQDLYDEETNFSRIFREQIRWNKFIEQQLLNHKDFGFTELELSLINFDED